ncbi:hypothetical protein CERZMDRAFT_85131 [Cercospora zeae-maydis SCOH1-5]|uniref:CCHC-type domain-containing protein n=1 Tax=Cercospora zeae-maydis SCOH1-5 TaxID=717836 RepID=A0A6A6FDZ5_9PEZI|nr:hypothetical protein CERZMDRAFT_85131 [Cercospora zeae-maydis SCOH1-5]
MPRNSNNGQRNGRNNQNNNAARNSRPRHTSPRNSSQNNNQHCTFCEKSGHARDDCRMNPRNWKCENENCRSRWSHDTSNCRQRNGNSRNEACEYCGRRGHASDDCRNKPSGELSTTSSRRSYCAHCNTIDHPTNSCKDELSFKRYSESLLRCARCREKGHSHDECQNPAGKRCTKCLSLGHGRDTCPQKNFKDLKSPATPARNAFAMLDRVKVDARSRFRLSPTAYEKLHKTQLDRLELERFSHDLEFNKGHLSEAEEFRIGRQIKQHQRYIEAEERRIFPRSPRSRLLQNYDIDMDEPTLPAIDDIYLPNFNGVPVHSSSATMLGSRRGSTPTARLARWVVKEGGNANDPMVLQQAWNLCQEMERRITNKISNSRLGYQKSGVWNNVITLHELAIMESGVVTQQRMDQIKWLIRQGALIHRDPMTMAALFARKVPICSTCGTRGVIVDEHFQPVPVDAPVTELYLLKDVEHPFWGLFIVFECNYGCSSKGYRFVRVPLEEMNGKDLQNDPLYYPYGDF